jgi:type IV pilus assembly protein PilO
MDKIHLTNDQLGKIAAGVVFTALFLYFYVVYFWLPVSNKIEQNVKANISMAADIARAKAQKAKCPDLEITLASLRKEKEAMQQRLPRERQLPDLIKTLTSLSSRYKVNISNIAPGGTTKGEYFMRTIYQVSLTGDYHALGRFLTALGLEVRILNVENLNITGTLGGETSASASFTLVAYQYSAQ